MNDGNAYIYEDLPFPFNLHEDLRKSYRGFVNRKTLKDISDKRCGHTQQYSPLWSGLVDDWSPDVKLTPPCNDAACLTFMPSMCLTCVHWFSEPMHTVRLRHNPSGLSMLLCYTGSSCTGRWTVVQRYQISPQAVELLLIP